MIQSTRAGVLLTCGLLATGCSGAVPQRARESTSLSRSGQRMLLQAHGGLTVGTHIAPVRLSCGDGKSRTLAAVTVQLVTFTTPGDCSACQTHLAGLDSLDRLNAWSVPHIYVSYATKATRDGTSREYKRILHEPVCWDENGSLWKEHDINHTPVTVLLRDGIVVLVHDAPLTSGVAMQRLLDTVSAFRRVR